MEIVYSVTIVPERDIEEQYLRWLQEVHIEEVLATGCFDAHRLYKVLSEDESEGSSYNIQYITSDMSRYFNYIHNHAPAMRAKGIEEFGEKFHAFRTVLRHL